MFRNVSIPKHKLTEAKNTAANMSASFTPDTLDQCTAPEPDMQDGLTQDEKIQAIKRLDAAGRSRSSDGALEKIIKLENGTLGVKYGWVCQCGFYPDEPKKKNQDNILVDADLSDTAAVFAVFDGHGSMGTEASTFAVSEVGKHIRDPDVFHVKREEAFSEVLVKVNNDMHKEKTKRRGTVNDTLSGTTAICVLLEGTELIVANVGDSRAIVAEMENDMLKPNPLSVDQTPYRKDERLRCKKAGAVVMTMDQLEGYKTFNPSAEDWGDEEDDGADPPRLWINGQGRPGVAFTRSLGDELAESIGCYGQPEILSRTVLTTDRFVVIASDGVWEFLSSQTVVDMVSKFTCPYEAARALVAEAYKLWLYFEVRTDDITAIVLFLDKQVDTAVVKNKPSRMRSFGAKAFSEYQDISNFKEEMPPVRREMSRRKREVLKPMEEEEEEEKNQDALCGELLTVEERNEIKDAVSTNFLFQHLTPPQLEMVIDAFQLVKVSQGQAIISQGEEGDKFYVVGSGTYDCFIDKEGASEKVHTYKVVGGIGKPSFGELALMYSTPRAATVIAAEDGYVWALGRKMFRRVLMKRPNKELVVTLRKVSILETLGKSQLQRLAEIITEINFKEGDLIIKQGDIGDIMYLVKTGEVRCVIEALDSLPEGDETPDNLERPSKEVMKIKPGGYFGERALLHEEPRAASVFAVSNATCLYISRKAFEEVLGPLSAIMKKHGARREMQSLAHRQIAENLKKSHFGPNLSIFQNKAQIRCVVSANDHTTIRLMYQIDSPSEWFTLSTTSISKTVDLKLQSRYMQSRNLMPLAGLEGSNLKPNFTFPILKTFIGKESLHMAFQGVACGTLDEFMASPLSPDIVKFLCANITLLIESLHSKSIICRSINPTCLMLDNHGYLRLMDLGFGKYLEDDSMRTYTMCGEKCYLAPEQVLNQSHSYAVDFWSLGVLIFEMVTGNLPFEDNETIFEQISNFKFENLTFPENVPEDIRKLVGRLMECDMNARLCSAKELKEFEGFGTLQWDSIANKTYESPLKNTAEQTIKDLMDIPTPRGDTAGLDAPPNTAPEVWYKDF